MKKKEKKKMEKSYNIEIEIFNIEADEFYYSFNYQAVINGKLYADEISDDHAWHDDVEGFKQHLKNSGALELVFENLCREKLEI